MTNGNDVTHNTKHTIIFNKKNLLRTLFLQPTHQRVYYDQSDVACGGFVSLSMVNL